MLSLLSTARRASAPLAIAILLASRGWSAEPSQNVALSHPTGGLVQAALEKEISGDNSQRAALLQRAIEESPKDTAAHWQLGEVRVRGKWQTVSQAEQAARLDKRLAEYARRRDAAGMNVDDQVALARWCRRNQLDEQARVHWMLTLQFQPDNAEATTALGLRWYGGMMLTPRQIDQFKARLHRVSLAADRWRPLVTQWLTAIESRGAVMPREIWERLAKVSDPCEILGLERSLWLHVGSKGKKQDYHRMTLAITLALANNPYPAGAEALARGAVFPEFNNVRSAAVEGLKRHPLDHYAPLLLSGLQSPIEATGNLNVMNGGGSWALSCSLYQEGALADLSFSYNLVVTPMVEYVDGTVVRAEDTIRAVGLKGLVAGVAGTTRAKAVTEYDLYGFAADFSRSVERTNAAIHECNLRIVAALRPLTGLDLGDDPMEWWKWWWQDYTEMHTIDGTNGQPKPVYDYQTSQEYVRVVFYSCFAPGTKVWTLTGRRPIEKIKIGDCVLAQEVESGELAYKPVLATTVRQRGPRMRVRLGGESIVATTSHPFWVLGQGWRMTKQLETGNRVHTPSGSVLIESIEKIDPDPSPAGKSYNLIVADFNSYFVGDRGILVHDNMPRAPTAALLPGLVKR